MATEYISPNMELVVPVPTQDPGPNWSYALNASLTIIDGHNHVSGSGVPIPTAGLNINASLDFHDFSALNLFVAAFSSQASALSPVSPNVGCAYSVGANGELFWNDANGHSVQITLNGSVAVSGAIGFTGLPSGTAAANYLSASGTFQFLQATGIGANLDVASIAIRYPGSYPTPAGNYIQLEAPSSLGSGYSLVLPALPAQTNVMTLGNTGIISSTTWDAVGQNMSSVGANAIGVSMNSTGANAVANSRTRAVATSVAVGGVAISASCGTYNTFSLTPVAVTNLSVTITTSGRPVFVGLISEASTNGSWFISNSNSFIQLLNITSGQPVGAYLVGGSSTSTGSFFPTAINAIDVIGAGTYTYSVYAYIGAFTSVLGINYARLIAYEL